MKINPLFLIDCYKACHVQQYPPGTELVYSNWTARRNCYGPPGVNKVVFFGLQYFIKEYLQRQFNENFFGKPIGKVIDDYRTLMRHYVPDGNLTFEHIEQLHSHGYLPLNISAVDEGQEVPIGVPMLTIYNTTKDTYWLTNYIETLLSNQLWLACTSATMALYIRRQFDKYAEETGADPGFIPYQGHDFSFRGMGGLDAACLSGAAHLLSFYGTDTIPAIEFLQKYYGADWTKETIGSSVAASEHSVMSAGGQETERETFRRLLTEVYPSGIVSIVSDTYDYWSVFTDILPSLKDEILSREGKCVVRPDCLDEESQILTPSGWKYFRDLSDIDLVAQVKEDNSYEFVKPTRIINQPYEGDMYHLHDYHGKVDLVVTPNHRLVSYNAKSGQCDITEAQHYKKCHYHWKVLRSPRASSDGVEISFYERFLIALQADGTIRYTNKQGITKIEFNIRKQRKIDRLTHILNQLGWKYTVNQYTTREGQSIFYVDMPEGCVAYKDFGWVDIATLSHKWSLGFIDELRHWDASIRNDGRFKYDSTIAKNADVVEYIAIAAGKGVLRTVAQDDRKEHFSDVHTMHILDTPFAGGQSLKISRVPYKGRVYCVQVPTGMILVKRNRGICVTGNSGTPEKIICGNHEAPEGSPEYKGTLQLLWETFGGTINSEGYKVLNPKVGCIYGDGINIDRQHRILEGMKQRGFASSNIVLGFGSYTYQYATRDNYGFAVKATYCEIDGKGHPIFKDPKTGDGMKKSLKGLLRVNEDWTVDEEVSSNLNDGLEGYVLLNQGRLKTVFANGFLMHETTLSEIRQRLNGGL